MSKKPNLILKDTSNAPPATKLLSPKNLSMTHLNQPINIHNSNKKLLLSPQQTVPSKVKSKVLRKSSEDKSNHKKEKEVISFKGKDKLNTKKKPIMILTSPGNQKENNSKPIITSPKDRTKTPTNPTKYKGRNNLMSQTQTEKELRAHGSFHNTSTPDVNTKPKKILKNSMSFSGVLKLKNSLLKPKLNNQLSKKVDTSPDKIGTKVLMKSRSTSKYQPFKPNSSNSKLNTSGGHMSKFQSFRDLSNHKMFGSQNLNQSKNKANNSMRNSSNNLDQSKERKTNSKNKKFNEIRLNMRPNSNVNSSHTSSRLNPKPGSKFLEYSQRPIYNPKYNGINLNQSAKLNQSTRLNPNNKLNQSGKLNQSSSHNLNQSSSSHSKNALTHNFGHSKKNMSGVGHGLGLNISNGSNSRILFSPGPTRQKLKKKILKGATGLKKNIENPFSPHKANVNTEPNEMKKSSTNSNIIPKVGAKSGLEILTSPEPDNKRKNHPKIALTEVTDENTKKEEKDKNENKSENIIVNKDKTETNKEIEKVISTETAKENNSQGSTLININMNINNNIIVNQIEKQSSSVIRRISKIDSCSIAGFSQPNVQKINQDNFFIEKGFFDDDEHFFVGVW
ncbi:MAG: hypothetical protein MJ252_00350 [archaeon]|nr:hypothetical protein [archaeon]